MECKECCREITEEDSKLYKGYCRSCYKEKYGTTNNKKYDNKNETNSVSDKINLIVSILHFIGYGLSLISGIALFINEEVLYGFVAIVIGIIITLLSTIFLEAISEIIQLLEDIKNK